MLSYMPNARFTGNFREVWVACFNWVGRLTQNVDKQILHRVASLRPKSLGQTALSLRTFDEEVPKKRKKLELNARSHVLTDVLLVADAD
jgi:hypothetical protein